MAETEPLMIMGNHDVTFYSRSTGVPVARYRVTGGVTIDMPAEFAELRGGSNLFAWRSCVKSFNPTASIVGRQISADILETSLNATVAETAASTTGDVVDEGNFYGTSVIDAAEGIATITPTTTTGDAELKEGWYAIKATAAATCDIYAWSSQNFNRGTDEGMENDLGKINDSAITIPASGSTVDVENFGLTLTGGSSAAIAMTTNDTAIFYVVKPHGGRFVADIGAQPMTFPEYGCLIASEDDGDLLWNIRLYRVKPAGMSLPFPEKDYGEFTVNMSVLYDATANAIGDFRMSQAE